MAFFRRDNETPAARPASGGASPESVRAVTRIAAGTRVEGVVSGATELLVEGEVRGEVRVEASVTVAPGGRVHGDLVALSVVLAGAVEGNVRCGRRVEIASTGALHGDVAAPKVVLAEGAFLKGKIEMSGEGAAAGPAPAGDRSRAS